ncbi:MAG: hypothetical protein KKE50_04190 [Nanoarchaeota archaeon]|nr:hypothetical protein [Nanoarchaeota archaeon]
MVRNFEKNRIEYRNLYNSIKSFARLLDLEEQGHKFSYDEIRKYHKLFDGICKILDLSRKVVVNNLVGLVLTREAEKRERKKTLKEDYKQKTAEEEIPVYLL